eukprot:640827-Prymnesium_polylepis.3
MLQSCAALTAGPRQLTVTEARAQGASEPPRPQQCPRTRGTRGCVEQKDRRELLLLAWSAAAVACTFRCASLAARAPQPALTEPRLSSGAFERLHESGPCLQYQVWCPTEARQTHRAPCPAWGRGRSQRRSSAEARRSA